MARYFCVISQMLGSYPDSLRIGEIVRQNATIGIEDIEEIAIPLLK